MARGSDISVVVGADISALTRGMSSAGRSVDQFGDKSAKMAGRMVKIGAGIAASVVGIGLAGFKLASSAAQAATDIGNLARVAGTSTTEFQRWTAATETVGISQEKLSDILKDVQDRVGDFLSTGGGPMADFFENIAPKVGVTADQFARLSGPEALQLYVTSLEKANVTQSQMTFYLEAMASDTTALLPLLKNGGQAIRALGDEAERSGRVLSRDMIDGAAELDKELDAIADTIKTQFTAAVVENKDELLAVANFIADDVIPTIADLIELVGAAAEAFGLATRMGKAFMGIDAGGYGASENPFEQDPRSTGSGGGSTTGLHFVDENGNVQEFTDDTKEADLLPPGLGEPGTDPEKSKKTKGPTEDDLERLRESLMTEREAINDHYQDTLKELEEFRAAKLGTEEEFNDLEKRAAEEHQEALTRLEKQAQQSRMQAISGALGDLGSLMQSENEKLFKIGKAARVAEAVVDGYTAAVSAWEKGMKVGGPPIAAAFTAASLAKTGMLISQIGSTSIGGGSQSASAGGGVASSGAVASGGSATSNSVALQLNGEIFGRDQILSLINGINEAQEDGAALIRLV